MNELKPEGKDFSHITMTDEGIAGVQWFHRGVIFYGNSFNCDCPPCNPSTPIADCPSCC